MSDDIFHGIKRRRFLVMSSGLLGSAFARSAWSARPCPPAGLSVDGVPGQTITCAPTALPVLTLTSAAPSGTYSWTFGQVFKKGDVPSGSFISTDAEVSQSDIRNRWSDGSAKYAVLSGRSTFQQNVAKNITIATTTSAPGGTMVTEPTTLNVSVAFTGDVSGTYTLQSCLGADLSSWNKSAAGRVRQILGSVMSEFHYYRPTSDAHVAVWFYVRRYATGETEVETVVENGWLNVGSPGIRNYGVTVSVNGATVYSASLAHQHHARWSRVDWVGTNPQIRPRHDTTYLIDSRMVPNYAFRAPTSAAWTNLASALNPTPFANGNWTPNMADTGAQDSIGILPRWEALYCTTGDSRAYNATISNVRGHGRWNMHYRDETTGRIPRHESYPNMSIDFGWGGAPPSASGGSLPLWDVGHHNSAGYLAYLIEGRWPFLEEQMNAATYTILNPKPGDRNPAGKPYKGAQSAISSGMASTRGAAWSWRTVGQAAAIAPTALGGASPPTADSDLRSSLVASVDGTSGYLKERYIDGTLFDTNWRNTRGVIGLSDGDAFAGGTQFWSRCWMQDFQVLALGYISDLEIETVNVARLAQVRDFAYTHVVQRMGTNATYNFRRGAQYNIPIFKNWVGDFTSPQFMTLAETVAAMNYSALSDNNGDTLKQSGEAPDMGNDSSSDGGLNGYWAIAITALSYAVDHAKPGALDGWNRVHAAPNYNPGAHGANDSPNFGVVPR